MLQQYFFLRKNITTLLWLFGNAQYLTYHKRTHSSSIVSYHVLSD